MSDGLTKLGEAARRARAAISPWNFFSPSDVAGFAPGGGIPSAVEPYKQGLQKTAEATKAFRDGRYGDAARWYGSGVLDTGTAALSALPEGGALTKLAMAVAPAVRAVAGSADEVADVSKGAMSKLQGIRAFHGSPHDFDRFSMDKIGTGEGAQAYGHGLYFAEAEDVAKNYKNAGPASKALYDEVNARMSQLAKEMDANSYGYNNFKDKELGAKQRAEYDALMQKRSNLGSMYEVRINADPEQFLDWDKPLSEQSEAVRQALSKVQGFDKSPGVNTPLPLGDQIKRGLLPNTYDAADAQFSKVYGEAGIPGIKYLDAGSRSAGDGSRNYVVFDDALVEIVKKYGWAPGMAIPAAMALELQQAQEQSAPQM